MPLTDVEFGDKLETIQGNAFYNCRSLRTVTMPSVRTIGKEAFYDCYKLSDVECGESMWLVPVDGVVWPPTWGTHFAPHSASAIGGDKINVSSSSSRSRGKRKRSRRDPDWADDLAVR